MIYDITPCPKPRMTRGDRWKKRPAVQKYWAFKDECRLKMGDIDLNGKHIIFGMPMPKSWSKKKKEAMKGQPHIQRPDLDNLLKGLGDALYAEDSGIHTVKSLKKRWSTAGFIQITDYEVIWGLPEPS